jgi:ephrin-B
LFVFQWVEESFTDFGKGINWRSYVVCDVQFRQVDNWLLTPFIERGPGKRIHIEMKFSVRDCSMYPGETRTCKETFSLLYHEFDVAPRSKVEPSTYVLVDRIAADEGRFSQNTEVIINSEIRSVPVNKRGLYFAFRYIFVINFFLDRLLGNVCH